MSGNKYRVSVLKCVAKAELLIEASSPESAESEALEAFDNGAVQLVPRVPRVIAVATLVDTFVPNIGCVGRDTI